MKKKILLSLCSMLLLLTLAITVCASATMGVSAATEELTVSFKSPAIPANTGETVDLSKYGVEFEEGTAVSADSISWSSTDITVTDGKVKPTSKGVYALTAKSGSLSKKIYLVAKAPEENEYILFEDDFSSDSLSTYTAKGNCSITDGKLVLNSKTGGDAYVLVPEWLGDFGNYSVSAKVNIKEANDNRRWISLMYRVKSSGSPFLQMAVRQNAATSDGVELAHNISGTWGYHFKGSYTEAFDPSTFYTLGLNVYEDRVSVAINGRLCGSSSSVTQVDRGTVGLRSNGSLSYFDDLKVTARFDTKGMPALPADTRAVDTNITLAPSLIYEIKNTAGLDGILKNSPAVAIMTLGKSGSIVASDGSTVCPLADAIHKLDEKVIPAIRLDASCDVASAAEIISSLMLKDLIFIADNANDIKDMRAAQGNVLCVYDLSGKELSSIDPTDIRADVLSTGAKICILPASTASQKNTEILNTLGVSVWYAAAKSDKVELFSLVTAGANGILTSDRALFDEVLASSVFKKNSIIRPVGIIGHRGTPALAPENTLKGSILAAANGANIIENDIYLTTDGVLVVMHDKTVDRTTNGTGNVESFSYEELCRLYVDCAPTTNESDYGRITDSQPIPTLEEYFAALKGTDTFMFIEVKSTQHEKLAFSLARLIDKYEIADQCGVIAFDKGAVKAIRMAIPEISVGYLCSDSSLDTIIGNVSSLESSYNPDQSKVTPSLLRDLADRGIFTWPWTIRNSSSFDNFFLMGVSGITTDNSYFAKNYVKRISTKNDSYTVTVGTAFDLNVTAETYGAVSTNDLSNRTYDTTAADMLVIDGNESLVYVNGRLMATEAGDATVIFRLAFKLNNGQTAFVYSEPVTISAAAKTDDGGNGGTNNGNTNNGNTNNGGDGNNTTATSTTKPSATTSKTEEDGGCGSSLSTLGIAIITLGLGLTLKRKID